MKRERATRETCPTCVASRSPWYPGMEVELAHVAGVAFGTMLEQTRAREGIALGSREARELARSLLCEEHTALLFTATATLAAMYPPPGDDEAS